MGIYSDTPVSNGRDQSDTIDVQSLSNKYAEEKERRQRVDGLAQNEELEESEYFSSLADDPFVDHDALNAQHPALVDGQKVMVIILGAGFGGILFAARLVEAGVKPEDIRLVDVAGGFGGTWYWNRYPGVMCDTEASVYLPMLEEMGYMPKHKYSYGEEIRGYIERIASRYGFSDQGMFRTAITKAEWNDENRLWSVSMEQNRGPGQSKVTLKAHSQFLCLCNGVLNHPKAPKVPGLEYFKGQIFHAARWNYKITGGSSTDQQLTELSGKKVGILGTGPTAIQAIPKLAEASKELYVFQRTPASISSRGQKATDQAEWVKHITGKPGWQLERLRNWELLCQGEAADDRFMTDGWTKLKTFGALIGRSDAPEMTKDIVQGHIKNYTELDAPFQDRIRHRVDEIVHDRQTAEALKPWYPTWCKRPGFHDEYLETFNLPNVQLVDIADTKGISGAFPEGLLVGERRIELDVLVLSTGFRPIVNLQDPDPGAKSNTILIGRDSIPMADKWAVRGAATLFGSMTHSFPNLLLAGTIQSAVSSNNTGALDALARHAAYIVTESLRRADDADRVAIEPSEEAEESWSAEILKYDLFASPIAVCTPGFFNCEGEALKPVSAEEELKRRRGSCFMRGLPVFRQILDDWKTEGQMAGLIVRS
ncbi:hypothetical protein Daus18300_009567 [Diaporthe australafricana]|uniref:FAD/NAD(P)-binding domain-containing protein n=1 Tax=Diaporthe australafricana TaxID=127596 RepID=A0ABR3WDM4_9PEZI